MPAPQQSPSPTSTSPDLAKDAAQLVRPDELQRIAEEKQQAELHKDLVSIKSEEQHEKELHRAFMEKHLHPEAVQRFSKMVRDAAERGDKKIEIVRFPSDWCTDRGRAINNSEAEWPATLAGIAKEGYEAFDKWLRPLGYHISARIVSYPGGMPGDVALYVSW